jgi:hypothetical protein
MPVGRVPYERLALPSPLMGRAYMLSQLPLVTIAQGALKRRRSIDRRHGLQAILTHQE